MTGIIKGYAQTSAGQVHYRKVAGEGDPVLFFHRTPVCSSSFEKALNALAGWRPLYAFDTPGSGESFVPPPGVALDYYRDVFVEAIDDLGIDRFHLVGHHTGTHFTVEIAAAHPQRTLSMLIDGAMYSLPEEREQAKKRDFSPPQVTPAGDHVMAGWNFLLPFYPNFDAKCIHAEFVGAMRTLFTRETCLRALSAEDYRDVLGRVQCPVHACCAEDDVFVGHLERIARDYPDIPQSIYGPAGIAGPDLQTDAFTQTVRSWVDGVAAGASAALEHSDQ